MSKILNIAAGLAVLPVLAFSAPVLADNGQLGGGEDIFVVKNLKGGDYAKTVPVACGESVKYSIRLHNTEFVQLDDINVKVGLGATTTMNAVPGSNPNAAVSESVSITGLASGQSLSYVAGTTKQYNEDLSFDKNLSDGITSSNGLAFGSLAGSTTKFVNFEAKLNCETEKPKDIKVCELSTKKVITIKEDEFDAAKHTKDLSKCNVTVTTHSTPTELTKTGPGSVAAIFAVTAVAATAAYSWVLRRQNAR